MEMNDNTSADSMKLQLGFKMRQLRKDYELKISGLADRNGLTSSTISQIERAIISPPSQL